MWGVTLFGVIFVGFFVLRGIAATVFFYFMLPDNNRCPICDEPTLRIEEPAWNRLMPWFRTSWCYVCGWEGLLRPGPIDEPASSDSHSGQLPLSSKKSS
jgi:hypothetical protein